MRNLDRHLGLVRRVVSTITVVTAVQLAFAGSGVGFASGARAAASAYGRVATLTISRKTQSLKAFTLASGRVTRSFHVNGNTEFIPRSSGADIQGFAQGDYAFVLSHAGIAASVEFDTSPFKPGPVEHLGGRIIKSSPHYFVMQDASTGRHKVWLGAQTSYYIGGQAQQHAFPIRAGEDVDVFAQKAKARWVAVSIDEQTSSGG
jgi:hypothetical protein